MAQACPKDDSPLSRRIARVYFLTALGDPELEIKVREREPSNLQAAYKTAIRLETLEKASSARQAESTPASMEVVKPSKGNEGGARNSRAAELGESEERVDATN